MIARASGDRTILAIIWKHLWSQGSPRSSHLLAGDRSDRRDHMETRLKEYELRSLRSNEWWSNQNTTKWRTIPRLFRLPSTATALGPTPPYPASRVSSPWRPPASSRGRDSAPRVTLTPLPLPRIGQNCGPDSLRNVPRGLGMSIANTPVLSSKTLPRVRFLMTRSIRCRDSLRMGCGVECFLFRWNIVTSSCKK